MRTLPRPIFPVGGVIVVVVISGVPACVVVVVTLGSAVVTLESVGVELLSVVVKVMGVPLRRPVITAVASSPRNELNSLLTLLILVASVPKVGSGWA